jgi:hypothetical protein
MLALLVFAEGFRVLVSFCAIVDITCIHLAMMLFSMTPDSVLAVFVHYNDIKEL